MYWISFAPWLGIDYWLCLQGFGISSIYEKKERKLKSKGFPYELKGFKGKKSLEKRREKEKKGYSFISFLSLNLLSNTNNVVFVINYLMV